MNKSIDDKYQLSLWSLYMRLQMQIIFEYYKIQLNGIWSLFKNK